jgi:hypothetical protein
MSRLGILITERHALLPVTGGHNLLMLVSSYTSGR